MKIVKSLCCLFMFSIIFSNPAFSEFLEVPGDKLGAENFVIVREYGRRISEEKSCTFYLMDKKTSKKQIYLMIPDFEHHHYHPAEFHNGNLYVVVRKNVLPAKNWLRKIIRYDNQKNEVELFSDQFGDFRVSGDEKYLAIVKTSEVTENGETLRLDILNSSGKLLKSFSAKELGLAQKNTDHIPLNLICFFDQFLWVCDGQDAGEAILNYSRIDLSTMKITTYEVPEDINGSSEFNPRTGMVLYDDYPFFADAADNDAYQKTKPIVHLYMYNIFSMKRNLINTSIAKEFNPQWVGADAIEFNDPNGNKRVQKNVKPSDYLNQ